MKMPGDKIAKIVDFFSSGCPVSEDHEIVRKQAQLIAGTVTSRRIGPSQNSSSLALTKRIGTLRFSSMLSKLHESISVQKVYNFLLLSQC